ncbi:hypothetical protein DYQ86_24515 [Acidobacteria bacterium AB60]|nr:hypothetical protein DYQ86_24515 [Acidobacteria bacterium AB60]
MSTKRFLQTSLAVLATLCLYGAPALRAQSLASSASLSGTVTDPSAARVAGASVTLASPDKGISRTYKTDAEGGFSFPLLPAGAYTLTVEAKGFKTFKQQGIRLEVGQAANYTATLAIGATEEIMVTTEPPLLQTDNANIGAEISSVQVTELPLNLRNVFNFVELNSSVNNLSQRQTISSGGEQGTADQDVSFLNFGGGYFGTTAFLLDGAWDTSTGWGGVIYVPSPDNVQEFKVQQNSFSAQYGWSTGNVVNVVTKSGTRSLHGVAYDYLRNGALDANFYFNNLAHLPRPNSHRNQFGVAVGGPVFIPGVYKHRDKTFWFFQYEGHRENDPLAAPLSTTPIDAFRNGDFSALLGAPTGTTDALCRPIVAGQIYDPFTTRQVTATCGPSAGKTVYIRDPIAGNNLANSKMGIDAVGQKLVSYYPKPLNNQVTNNWSATGVALNNSDEFSARIDHNVNDNTRIYGRYSYKKESKGESPDYYGANDPAGPGQINPNNRWNLALGGSHVFTPTFTLSANLGGMKWIEGNNLQSAGFKPSSLGLPGFIDSSSAQFPVINANLYLGEGPLQGAGEARFPRSAVSGSVDLVKVLGAHQLSFGFMQVAIDENGGRISPTTFTFNNLLTAGPDPTSPATGGDAIASMLLGTPVSGGTGVSVFNVSRTWLYGTYLQDDWKATRKLTLNLGLRWEVQTPITDRHNRLSTFNYSAVNPISSSVGGTYTGEVVFANSNHRGQYDTNYKHFAPRFGLTYQVMPKLVARGGFGFFYPNQFLNSPNIIGYTSSTPYVASNDGGISPCPGCTLSHAFPNGPVPVVGNTLGSLTNVGFSTSAVNPKRKTYYGEQWMGGIQFAPSANDVLDMTYVGNHNVHTLAGGLNLNQIDPKYFSMGNDLLTQVPNPFYGHVPAGSPCSLDQPTVAQGQLLRPHPEFCDINETQDPAGTSHYNALDINYTHRVSQGLTLLASYTFSKFIDDISGPEGWANSSAESIRNVYNLAAEKSVDPTDTPNSFVLSYVYELPVGKGKTLGGGMHGVANQILGGWETTGIFTLKEGFPLSINSPGNGLNYFGAGQHVDVVGNYKVAHQSRTQWFNNTPPGISGAAFAPASSWSLGNAPRYFSDLRAPHYNNWDIGVQKNFPIKESSRVEFRLDMFNAFNHTNFYSPNTSLPPLGSTSPGSFGTISESWTPRLLQAALRLYW